MPELKVVAYARVSSKEQAEKDLSIPAQLSAIRKHCKDKGWKLVGEYLDEGKSAKTADRPAFQKMIALAKKQNKHFDAIIVHKFDRFSRSRDDHVIYKALLKKAGVSVYSVTEQTDPETPHGFLLEGILEVISEFYNMNLANETRKGMVENAKRGYHNGGAPPYGYRIGKIQDSRGNEKSVWVLGPDEEVNTIRRIFNLYVYQSKGYKTTARLLNESAVPSPNGGLWSWTTVCHILHNEAYIGRKVWNKYDYVNYGKKKKPKDEWIVTDDAHPPIIDRDTFNGVIAKSQERHPQNAAYKSSGPSLYILRGLLKCPLCGVNMVTGSNGRKAHGSTRYYHCGTYQRKGKSFCKRNGVLKEKIESAVINALIREFSLLSFPGSLEDEIRKYVEYQNREITFELAHIDDEIKHHTKRMELVKTEKVTDDSKKFVAQYISELETDLNKLQRQKQEMSEQKTALDISPDNLQSIREKLKDFVARIKIEPPDVQHRMLKECVISIIQDQFSKAFKLTFSITVTTNGISDITVKVLEKPIYFSL